MTFRLRGREGRPALFDRARALESRLAEAMQKATSAMVGQSVDSPLEVVDRACDHAARYVHPAGRGRFAFPFNDIAVTFVAASAELQAQYDAICTGPPSLRDRFVRRVVTAGCEPPDIQVRVSYAAEPGPDWLDRSVHIAVGRTDPAARPTPEPTLRVELVITHGTADRGSYSFTRLPISIGRGSEVRDQRQHLLRINHVAFIEGSDEVTQSVSRRHARLELDPATSHVRLVDDNSAQGTSVIRNARSVLVPRGSRGLLVQSGDEIVLGQARMVLTLACE